jgi:DNA replication and repair protein RecF
MADRARALGELSGPFALISAELGLSGEPSLAYRPRSRAVDAAELAAELAERVDGDVDRGFTTHGPHRDDLVMLRAGRDLRAYGSQGQQRLALLALLLAERDAIASTRATPPVMLLDDVMSELDRDRRRELVDLLRAGAGQAVITTTDLDHVPGATEPGVTRVAVVEGRLLQEAPSAERSVATGAIGA